MSHLEELDQQRHERAHANEQILHQRARHDMAQAAVSDRMQRTEAIRQPQNGLKEETELDMNKTIEEQIEEYKKMHNQ